MRFDDWRPQKKLKGCIDRTTQKIRERKGRGNGKRWTKVSWQISFSAG